MAVQYYNGQLYDVFNPSMTQQFSPKGYDLIGGLGRAKSIFGGGKTGNQSEQSTQSGMYADPFGTAMSGTQSGTLQPYVNRMAQNASNALYGGLLGYQPQSMVAGNAGGTPINSQVPNWRLPSAIPTLNQGQIGLLGAQANPQQQMGIFGNRSWMAA